MHCNMLWITCRMACRAPTAKDLVTRPTGPALLLCCLQFCWAPAGGGHQGVCTRWPGVSSHRGWRHPSRQLCDTPGGYPVLPVCMMTGCTPAYFQFQLVTAHMPFKLSLGDTQALRGGTVATSMTHPRTVTLPVCIACTQLDQGRS